MTQSREQPLRAYLHSLQRNLCQVFADQDGSRMFERDEWTRPEAASSLQGGGVTAILEGGEVFERAGIALSDIGGSSLPAAATARHPHLAGQGFRAMGVSVVMHPRNPHVPTSHMNVRCLSAGDVWWFGGGFDLTPYLAAEDDIVAWHRAAAAACDPFHPGLYRHLRRHCDDYFYLKHRGEARGIGGIFYDDLNQQTPQFGMGWEQCLEFTRSVSSHYRDAYLEIVRRRCGMNYGKRERDFLLYRRGRYVEFNLSLDRGTLFGLQSGGRAESILMSLPPQVTWSYRSPDPALDAQLLPYLTTLRGHDWCARS